MVSCPSSCKSAGLFPEADVGSFISHPFLIYSRHLASFALAYRRTSIRNYDTARAKVHLDYPRIHRLVHEILYVQYIIAACPRPRNHHCHCHSQDARSSVVWVLSRRPLCQMDSSPAQCPM